MNIANHASHVARDRPRRVDIFWKMPKSATGKILKQVLRAHAARAAT